MTLNRSLLAATVAALLAAPAAHAEITIDDFWGSEVSFEGLVQADFVRYDRDHWNPNARTIDGANSDNRMRRAELVLKGKGPDNNEWVMGYDAYAKKWLDVNWKYKFGNNANHYLQVGQFKQPNSMEELSSTKNNDFISKASITNTFGMSRRVGVAYNYGDNNWAVQGTVFGRELTRGANVGNGFGLRGYWAPINDKGSILHLGVSYVDYAARNGGGVGVFGTEGTRGIKSYSARPMNDLSGSFISTGSFDRAKRVSTLGGEAMWVAGPFKLQGEYMRTDISRTVSSLRKFRGEGGYLSALWNATGETWGYKAGTPTTSLPNEPATGMVQVGVRYDTIDLNSGNYVTSAAVPYLPLDGSVLGGKMTSWTVGVNYYWHSNFKFALNYVLADMTRFTTRTAANYSLDPAWNARTINGNLRDKPRVLELRAQYYW